MTTAPVATLLRPFDLGDLSRPDAGQRWAFFNAAPLPVEEGEKWKSLLHCEQGFRGDYLALESQGYEVQPLMAETGLLDGALVLASRVRQVNEANLARAWNATRPGSVIVYCGDKNAGTGSLRKWAGQFAEVGGSLSKNHAIVFWITKTEMNWALPEISEVSGTYHIAPGMFSANGPDKGSQLLATQFSDRIYGHVADFGAGWGYLSTEVLKRSTKVQRIDLFDVDWNSLQAAKHNVGNGARFHWCDITTEPPRGPFNWIIMNPPFHTGRAAEPELGTRFIHAAAKALPAGGRLLMVANVNLPYEKTLQSLFRKTEMIVRQDGFKVIEAVKGS